MGAPFYVEDSSGTYHWVGGGISHIQNYPDPAMLMHVYGNLQVDGTITLNSVTITTLVATNATITTLTTNTIQASSNLTVNANGAGTIQIGNVSTGEIDLGQAGTQLTFAKGYFQTNNIGMGVTPVSYVGLFMNVTMTSSQGGGTVGIASQGTFPTTATVDMRGIASQVTGSNGTYNTTDVVAIHAWTNVAGTGQIVTNNYGFQTDVQNIACTTAYGFKVNQISGGTVNNYGIYIVAPSGTGAIGLLVGGGIAAPASGVGSNVHGGDIPITGGAGDGTGAGGIITLTAGLAGASGDGGKVVIVGGQAGSSGGNSGFVTITGAASPAGRNLSGGNVTLTGGRGGPGGTNGIGGTVSLLGGAAGTASGANGGQVLLVPGAADGGGLKPVVTIDGNCSIPTSAILSTSGYIGFQYVPGAHAFLYVNNAGAIAKIDLGAPS